MREIKTIYAENSVDKELIEQVINEVEATGLISVCFSVIGRTKHELLSYELQEQLPQYNFEIGYNYKCIISKNDKENC